MAGNEVRVFLKNVFWFIYDNFLNADERADIRDKCKEKVAYPAIREKWKKMTKAQKEHVRGRFESKHPDDIKYLDGQDKA
jgi:hypothetical protein